MNFLLALISLATVNGSAGTVTQGSTKPIEVYILAGQSNMEGHGLARIDPKRNGGKGSLEYLAQDPATRGRFGKFRKADGSWTVRDDVWIHYLGRKGKLTVGFGASDDRIGPEFGFGQVIGDATDGPVLLIKVAWGGKSLAVDFRPPSSGGKIGPYYTEVVQRTRDVLRNLKRDFPELGGRSYRIAGFGWHQGWNDRFDDAFTAEYEKNLANFIRDIRRDLGVRMPFVVAETGMGGAAEKDPTALALMRAQAAVAEHDEFKGNVGFVSTRPFWRDKSVSADDQIYHWNLNAETYFLIGEAMGHVMLKLRPARPRPVAAEMAGYLLVPHSGVDKQYNAGFSMYVAAWPLLREYPGDRFQTGLPGTWMFAQYDTKPEGKHYSDIEGGLGWWRDTRFATTTPKFIMGGVARDFVEWANGPGAGKGRDWSNPTGLYGIAQLSPYVIWPPDGLNLKQGTSGELFGYGYLPLPLATAKAVTAGKNVPTGDQCWTLFLNTRNFKGPVAFFLPYFFSKPTVEHPEQAGMYLDSRPSDPNRAIQMETQYVPSFLGTDSAGRIFARIAPTSFPNAAQGSSPLIHRVASYSRAALWDRVKAWFAGGPVASGTIDPSAAALYTFKSEGGSTWRIYGPSEPDDKRVGIDWNAFAQPVAIDPQTYGYRWDAGRTTSSGRLATLPEYYRLVRVDNGAPQWQPVPPSSVPTDAGLDDVTFGRPKAFAPPEPYVTPEERASSWKTPGPVKGPFKVRLGDGSVVTYSWYRFADQPALLNADMTRAEREAMQTKVELIHRHWKKDRQYLPPNTVGTLASLDPAVLVTPPKGLEVGYVPIVTRQAAR